MSWEIVQRGSIGIDPLGPGTMSITRTGSALFTVADLDAAGIPERVVLLADAGNLRLGFRAPRGEAERDTAATVHRIKRKHGPATRARLDLARAIRRLSLEPAAVAGRYTLASTGVGKSIILSVHLTPAKT